MNFSKLAKTFGFLLVLGFACSSNSFAQGAMATDTTVIDDSNSMVVDTVMDSNAIQAEPAEGETIMLNDTSAAAPVFTETPVSTPTTSVVTKSTEESTSGSSSRQKTLKGGRFYNRFSVGLNGGVVRMGNVFANTDYINNTYEPSAGIAVTGYLGHAFALQLAFNVQNDLKGDSIRYNNTFKRYNTKNGDISLNLVYNFGNISFIKRQPRFGMYAHIGIGVVRYVATRYSTTGTDETPYENRLLLPVGAGMKYMLTKQLTLSTGYMVKFADSDGLDNTYLSFNTDRYSYGYLGLSYTLGNKAKPSLEWHNPVAALYDDASNNDRINKLAKKTNALQEQLDSLNMNVSSRLDSLRMDSDGDGVSDFFDKQPNTPDGAIIDGAGRSLDSDGDGVFDAYDKCPFERGLPEYNGCKAAGGSTINLDGEEATVVNDVNNRLFFAKGSSVLERNTHKPLNKLAKLMKKNPNLKFVVVGYTDSDGGEMINNKLSQQRAEVVKDYLMKKDIGASRLVAVGRGVKKPFNPNASESEKQKNRTVVFEATSK